MNTPHPPNWRLATVLVLVVGGGAGLWWWKRSTAAAPSAHSPASAPVSEASVQVSTATPPVHEWLRTTLAQLKQGQGSGNVDVAGALKSLAARLDSVDKPEAARAMVAAIASGADAPTGLGFKLGPGGALAEAPTLRTFLLDQLSRIDPAAAAELGRSILASKSSPDEWALALRAVARTGSTDPAGRAYLEDRMRELLTHEPWQRDPSAGYLEAFDVAVHLGGTGLVPELTDLVRRTNNPALSHAAYLALDRLALRDPAALLGRLADDPALMAGREVTRANYFARAEAGDPAQRVVLERYLLDERRSAAEWEAFAGLYPNANYMVSHNLLTPSATPDGDELRRRDRAALEMVRGWMADPRFAAQRARLERIHARLDQFVRQAETR